jgi:hypothetical protein
MQIKALALTLAALVAGTTAAVVIPKGADARTNVVARALEANPGLEVLVLREVPSDNPSVAKRMDGCPNSPQGHPICITCFTMGYDICCTKNDMVTGETLDDGCDYYGR